MTEQSPSADEDFEFRVAGGLGRRAESIEVSSREDEFGAVAARAAGPTAPRRGALVAAAALVLLAVGLGVWFLGGDDDGSTVDLVPAGEGRSTTTSASEGGETADPLLVDPPGVDLDLLAVRSRPLEFALIDLVTGLTTLVGVDDHEMGDGFASGASISPRGDALVWRDGVYVFPGADMTATPTVLQPAEWRIIPGLASELHVVPTADGEAVWVSQSAYYWNDSAVPAVIDLIDVDTGEVRTTLEIAETISLVGAAGDSLVVNAWPPIRIDEKWTPNYGAPHVLVIAPDGSVESLRNGSATAAWGDRAAGVVEDELFIDHLPTGVRLEVERPEGFRWVDTGGPLIPSTAQPLPQVSGGGELVMYLVEIDGPTEDDGFPAEARLVAVSLLDGSVRELGLLEGLPLATWDRDGTRVVTVTPAGATVLPEVGSDGPPVFLPAPEGFFILGAG